jgi:DNA-binding transcriptional regulator GbsR (MarR family)
MPSGLDSGITFLLEHKPMSVECLSIITGIPSDRICSKLTQLEKWKVVKIVTEKRFRVWGLSGASDAG